MHTLALYKALSQLGEQANGGPLSERLVLVLFPL